MTTTPQELIARAAHLREDPSFRWWLEMAVTEPMAEADERRSDLSLTAEERTNALVEYLRLKKQTGLLEEVEATALRNLPKP